MRGLLGEAWKFRETVSGGLLDRLKGKGKEKVVREPEKGVLLACRTMGGENGWWFATIAKSKRPPAVAVGCLAAGGRDVQAPWWAASGGIAAPVTVVRERYVGRRLCY